MVVVREQLDQNNFNYDRIYVADLSNLGIEV